MRHSHQENPQPSRPRIAIIDPNTLTAIGLRQVLQAVMPVMQVDVFGSFVEFEANAPESYFHYFVAMNQVLENRPFFLGHRRKTIVLTTSADPNAQMKDFHSLCVTLPENLLIRSLLVLEQYGHADGRNLPHLPASDGKKLSGREIEVLSLIVRGFINKEIADRLHIGLSTVITHRRNIMEKLGVKSVSALTIYAVMNGYVDIDMI